MTSKELAHKYLLEHIWNTDYRSDSDVVAAFEAGYEAHRKKDTERGFWVRLADLLGSFGAVIYAVGDEVRVSVRGYNYRCAALSVVGPTITLQKVVYEDVNWKTESPPLQMIIEESKR